jgi:hypothetical protein
MAEFSFSGEPDEGQVTATGEPEQVGGKLKACPFGKYVVVVRLTKDDRFVRIEEIRLRKDFLTQKQRTSRIGSQDLDDIYRE